MCPLISDTEMKTVGLECDFKLRINPATAVAWLLAIDLRDAIGEAVREDPERRADGRASTARTRAEHQQPAQKDRSTGGIHRRECRAVKPTSIGTSGMPLGEGRRLRPGGLL